jgi:hypothetical protein
MVDAVDVLEVLKQRQLFGQVCVLNPEIVDGYLNMAVASHCRLQHTDRIRTTWFSPSPSRLARVDQAVARVSKGNLLTEGIRAATDYCRTAGLRCDFVLMPILATRRSPVGTEEKLVKTFSGLYPGFGTLARQMYKSAVELGPAGQVHDFTTVFDSNPDQVYLDGGHNNEAGSLAVADALLPIAVKAAGAK